MPSRDYRLISRLCFLLPGWTSTIALAAVSTPALTVAVSTCLEPRGGFLSPCIFYQKAALEGRGFPLFLVNFQFHQNFDPGSVPKVVVINGSPFRGGKD